MTPARLNALLQRFSDCRIAVVGDYFLDKYLDVDPALAEVSVETGKTANQVVGIRCYPGVAGTVVNNLAALGVGTLHAVGATGDDGEAYDLRQQLEKQNCSTTGLLRFAELKTPTYLKPRDAGNLDLSGEHERYDTKNHAPTPATVSEQVIQALDAVLPNIDALIIADQVEADGCGVITSTLRNAIAERVKNFPNVVFWADSRRRIHEFRHVVIKPNQFEAVDHQNPLPGEEIELERLLAILPELQKQSQAPVIITRGEKGMLVSDPTPTLVPGVTVPGPVDPTGAGDSVTAGAVSALAAGATLAEAALVGILVSSITVQQLATTGTASPQAVEKRLQLWREQNQDACQIFA